MKKKIAVVALAMSSVTGVGLGVGGGTVNADSRCSTSSHTHGKLWWKRTDNFLKRWNYSDGYNKKKAAYHHTNSSERFGCKAF